MRTVGASLHPWGLTGSRYASERGEPTGRSATPSNRTHRPAHHLINDTTDPLFLGPEAGQQAGGEAVSYTHLDVYKRQAVITALAVLMMTWLVMPHLVRLFKPWLTRTNMN